MFAFTLLGVVLAQIASSVAHGGVTEYSIGSTKYTGWSPYNSATGQVTAERPYTSYNPITSATDPTLACNNAGGNGPSPQDITIAAGTEITAYWAQWTHLPGPVTVWLALCPGTSCTGTSSASTSLQWFKIDERGLINGTQNAGNWGNGIVLNTLQWTSTIPSTLKPGAYLLRHELLAIHQANAPQWYPECVQLIVTGSGTAYPTSSFLKPIPGAYSMTDPGVNIDIYSAEAMVLTNYTIPGPPVWPA